MKFLVTGCNGYIGSHMVYYLRRLYPTGVIIGLDIKVPKGSLTKSFSSALTEFHHESIHGTRGTYDGVFHFAGISNIPYSESNPRETFHHNVEGTKSLLRNVSCGKFIFASSCSVYGNRDEPVRETMELTHPTGVYASSKAMAEKHIMASGIPYGILRFFNVAGRIPESGLRENHVPETHLIPILYQGNEVSVFGTDYDTPDGTAIRDYVHVRDICRAHFAALEGPTGTYNIGTGKGYSVNEVISLASKVYGKEYKVTYGPRRPGDAPRLVSDISHTKNKLQFSTTHDIMDILEDMK